MAKQQTVKKTEVTPQTKSTEAKTAPVQNTTKEPTWEIKDRFYFLKSDYSPIYFNLKARHTQRSPMLYFDEKAGFQRELKYATNQKSPFVEEQKGECTLAHIIFLDGSLSVPKENQTLQKLLSLYHPSLNKVYQEYDAKQEAVDDLDEIELEIEALIAAKSIDIEHAEAILRVESGSSVSSMSSKELKRDLLLFAKNNPALFLELANDENVQLRNFGIKAAENNIIVLSQDQRDFRWPNTDRKIMTVPFDENAYSALAAFFKTDEGVDVYKSIEKKMN
tara:strand:- start:146 stop:979 length:834 start_codon:yes stop_codon:yes gene_type:complete